MNPPPGLACPVDVWHNKPYEAISPHRDALSMKGKTVVVIGGAGVIGSATSRAFAMAGASRIVLLDSDRAALNQLEEAIEDEFNTADCVGLGVDVRDDAEMHRTAQTVGEWDVMVWSVAHLCPGNIGKTTPHEWWSTSEIMVKGLYNSLQAFLPTRNGGAKVLALQSAMIQLSPAYQVHYSSFSVAVTATTKLIECAAAENSDVFFANYHAGAIETANMERAGFDAEARQRLAMDDVRLPAHTAVWLASPEAAFLRGRFIWANWDVEKLKEREKEIEASQLLTLNLLGVPLDGMHSRTTSRFQTHSGSAA